MSPPGEWRRDVRHTARALRKNPGYSLAAVLTLAVCLAANTSMFAAVQAVLFRPLAIRAPNELVICWANDRPHSLPVVELSYRNVEDWAAHSESFSQVAAIGSSSWPAIWDTENGSTRLAATGVSVPFFDVLGAAPLLGRTFRPDDDAPKAARVVILSHRLWASRFGGDSGVIGRRMALDVPHTIVGVMPERFDFPRGTDLWTPVVPILADAGRGWNTDGLERVGVLFAIGRLRPGHTPRRAADELNRLVEQRTRDAAAHQFGSGAVVTPFLTYVYGPVRQALWALLAAVLVLLLIGCANVSGLVLIRVSQKRREQAVRLALGATRAIVARRWIVETGLIALAGGVAGLIVSPWIVAALVMLAPGEAPGLADMTISVPVAALTGGVILLAALVCGAGPALMVASTVNLAEVLNDSARLTPSRHTHRARSALVLLQISLSVTLLIGAGLVGRSVVNLRRLDLGFDPTHVVTMTVDPRDPKPSANEWVHELLERVRTLPMVSAAGAVSLRPLALGPIGQETSVLLDGQPDTQASLDQNPRLNYQVATPEFFSAMRIPLQRGRVFADSDDRRSPRVALVSERTAHRLWPGQEAIGKRVRMPQFAPDTEPEWRTVIGVVKDVHYRELDDVRLDIYDAALQAAMPANDLMIRTSGDPRAVIGAVQAAVRRFDPRVVIGGSETMDAVVARAIAPWRFSVWLFGAFAGVAFMLASLGLFSLVSLDVVERAREWAIRRTLGAQDRNILGPVMFSAARRALIGTAAGVLTAFAGVRGIRSLLFGVQAVDMSTYAAVVALVGGVVVLAAYGPARRAVGVDPAVALRSE